MPTSGTPRTDKISKTQQILAHIAEHGPKTEYDLYRELPGVSHGTIHFCLESLTQQRAITLVTAASKEGRPKKLYNLTFLGTVTRLASYSPNPEIGVTHGEEAGYWASFDVELQDEVVEFLERQGQLQNYAPFQEIRWLLEHFTGAAKGLVIIASIICQHPPSPYKKPVAHIFSHIVRGQDLERMEAEEDKNMPGIIEKAFRDNFTDFFFQMVPFLKRRGKTSNPKLHQLAKENLEERLNETWEIERVIELFGRRKSSKTDPK